MGLCWLRRAYSLCPRLHHSQYRQTLYGAIPFTKLTHRFSPQLDDHSPMVVENTCPSARLSLRDIDQGLTSDQQPPATRLGDPARMFAFPLTTIRQRHSCSGLRFFSRFLSAPSFDSQRASHKKPRAPHPGDPRKTALKSSRIAPMPRRKLASHGRDGKGLHHAPQKQYESYYPTK